LRGVCPRPAPVAGTPLLTRPSWLPALPVPLADVRLYWDGESLPAPVTGTELELRHILPSRRNGIAVSSYAEAIEAFARPKLFENRQCYRLLSADASGETPALAFGRGQYFDVINICEAAAHEYAAAALTTKSGVLPDPSALPFRAAVGDPTDLARRPVMTATSTLTVRHDRRTGQADFFLHWRDPQRVATGDGLHHIMPVGMFQPSHDAPWNEANDFGLWQSTRGTTPAPAGVVQSWCLLGVLDVVVPAPAGVVPRTAGPAQARRGRPRACGGGSRRRLRW
jgi:hypothetical protein